MEGRREGREREIDREREIEGKKKPNLPVPAGRPLDSQLPRRRGAERSSLSS